MASQQDLQDLLLEFTDNVYFQPPPSLKMLYPCIIYKRDFINMDYADNAPYKIKRRYSVTVVDQDPDSPIIEKLIALPLCSFDRNFASDNLNHDVFNLFF